MLTDFYATKIGMTQAWTKSGKRLAITRCKAADLSVLGHITDSLSSTAQTDTQSEAPTARLLEVAVGSKKLKNVAKPQRSRAEKAGIVTGMRSIKTLPISLDAASEAQTDVPAVGTQISVDQVLAVGDVVQVQGVTKGRGFAGAVKRHGFHGGPKTHGQSDRTRAVGSIGAGTTPGRVIKGKRMPGHFGVDTQTVKGLTIVHLDTQAKEVWLSGPIPGATAAAIRIRKTGESKPVDLDIEASGILITPSADETVEASEKAEPVSTTDQETA